MQTIRTDFPFLKELVTAFIFILLDSLVGRD